jgi:hypothetical protein
MTNIISKLRKIASIGILGLAPLLMVLPSTATAQSGTNACPVDGCVIKIKSMALKDGELEVEFDANFVPSLAKNHFHVWWSEKFDIKQVTSNAESKYGMTQGSWHPTDDFPMYMTRGVVSYAERGTAETICVTASDRNHEILDSSEMDCQSVAGLM